ncbi:MAG: thioredoxin family protein [Desulfobacterales bacterium]|jgi:hypothetical protein
MFTALEKKQILKLENQLAHNSDLRLMNTEHKHAYRFEKFCVELSRLLPKLQIKRSQETPDSSPQILLKSNLRYQAVPTGAELLPFLEAVKAHCAKSFPISKEIKRHLDRNSLPAELTLYIAPHCTFCPTVVRQLFPLPMVSELLQLTIVDVTLFPEMGQADDIRAVPTLYLDKQFRWIGSVPLEEMVDMIVTRDPFSLGAVSLERMLKNGDAGDLAAMMVKKDKVFPAFYELVTHEKWPVRLGAMVAVEEIVAQNPNLAIEMLNPLWDRFHSVTNQIKGDILHVIGEIGSPTAVDWLEAVLKGVYDTEIKDAAKEALEKLKF